MFASQPSMLWGMLSSRVPQFKEGDKVIVVSPGIEKGEHGVVIQVVGHVGDYVFRYDVRFADGTAKRYFGFEIEPVLSQSA